MIDKLEGKPYKADDPEVIKARRQLYHNLLFESGDINLTDRELGIIHGCQVYAYHGPAGKGGHNVEVIIDKLVKIANLKQEVIDKIME